MFLNRLGNGAKDNPLLSQSLAESCLNRYRIHYSIHRHIASQSRTFLQRNTQFVERLHHFRINLLVRRFCLRLGSGVVRNRLKINLRNIQMCPFRHFHRQPFTICLQPKLQQPFRLIFLCRNKSNHILIKSGRNNIRFDIRRKTVLIILARNIFDYFFHSLSLAYSLRFLNKKTATKGGSE